MIDCHPSGLGNRDWPLYPFVLHQQLAPRHCWFRFHKVKCFQLCLLLPACSGPQPSSGELPFLIVTQRAPSEAQEEMICLQPRRYGVQVCLRREFSSLQDREFQMRGKNVYGNKKVRRLRVVFQATKFCFFSKSKEKSPVVIFSTLKSAFKCSKVLSSSLFPSI